MSIGRLVILSGPSGVGKDTVIDAWMAKDPHVERVIAYTTREPRRGEVNGVDYWFVSRPEFLRMVGAGEFLEHKEVVGNFYATPVRHAERILMEDRIAVLKIDVQGALEVMKKRPNCITVFLLPPTKEALRERLLNRGTDSPEVITKRILAAVLELAEATKYQHQIVNRNVADVVAQLMELTTR